MFDTSICPACEAGDHDGAEACGYHGLLACACACNGYTKAERCGFDEREAQANVADCVVRDGWSSASAVPDPHLPSPEQAGLRSALVCESDREYRTRIDAERCTLEFAQKSARKMDGGKLPMDQSPLFGGQRQGGLFE